MSSSKGFLFFLPWSLDAIGGVNRVVWGLALEMRRSGCLNPIILINDWSCSSPKFSTHGGITVIAWRVRAPPSNTSIRQNIGFYLWRLKFNKNVKKFFEQYNIVCVNSHYPDSAAIALMAAVHSADSNIKFFLSYHGSDVDNLRAVRGLDASRWLRCVQKADAIIACSQSLKDRISCVINMRPIHVVYNGLDFSEFVESARLKPSTVSAEGRSYILSVGKFDANKNQTVLIQAFSKIAENYPSLDLFLVGSEGDRLGLLRDAVAQVGLSGRILFFVNEPHESIARFYRDALIFVLPSRKEAFALVLLEAAAFHIPIVVARNGAAEELIVDDLTGKLFQSEDQDALVEKLRHLLAEPSLAESMGEKFYSFVSAKFTWEVAVKKYCALIDE